MKLTKTKPKRKSKKVHRVSYECPRCFHRVLEGIIMQTGKRMCPSCFVKKSQLIELIKSQM